MTEIVERPHLQRTHRMRGEEIGTLGALAERVTTLAETKRDFIVDTRRMSFATDDGTSYLTFDTEGHDDVAGGPVNEHAHGQIRERLKVPATYYNRMRAEAPALLDTNVQHWLSHPAEGKADKRMVRMLEGKVRAFLSNRYRRLDHIDLLERAVLPELQQHGGNLTFHVAALTDEKLYIRVLLENLKRDVQVGQIVQAGVQIKNSEVGDGALDIAPFIWKLDCLNGMVSNVGRLRRYHVGREQEETAYAMWRDDTLAAIDTAFFMQVRDAVNEALSATSFELIVAQLRKAVTGEAITEPVAATERLATTLDLGDREKDSVLMHLAAGGDLSQWGAANAVTAAAKNAETFARQEEMENLGFALATMPASDWSRIAR